MHVAYTILIACHSSRSYINVLAKNEYAVVYLFRYIRHPHTRMMTLISWQTTRLCYPRHNRQSYRPYSTSFLSIFPSVELRRSLHSNDSAQCSQLMSEVATM